MESKLYTVEEASDILKLHPKTVRRFIAEGRMGATKIGRAWMIPQSSLAALTHQELAAPTAPSGSRHLADGFTSPSAAAAARDFDGFRDRITVSTVIEVSDQSSHEASRISNTLVALLNSQSGKGPSCRFDAFHYPEERRSRFVLYGSPAAIAQILSMFEVLCQQKE